MNMDSDPAASCDHIHTANFSAVGINVRSVEYKF